MDVYVSVRYAHSYGIDGINNMMKRNDPLPAEPCEEVQVSADLTKLLIRNGQSRRVHATCIHGQHFINDWNHDFMIVVTPGVDTAFVLGTKTGNAHSREILMITRSSDGSVIEKILLSSNAYEVTKITLTKRYIEANCGNRYVPIARKNPPVVTVFHAGFPDVRPAILPAMKFVQCSHARLQSCDGNFTVSTVVALTEADVDAFELSFDNMVPTTCGDAVLAIFAELQVGTQLVQVIKRV